MCGLVGYWGRGDVNLEVADAMSDRIRHRGPDDSGVWFDSESGLVMMHRRLSILDLSPAGHQPMVSGCGRYVLVYNGEIYNHLDIREELSKFNSHLKWRGASDTETLLVAIAAWGVEATLKRLNGMFAFSLWDRFEKKMYLARDRMGEKPLYYGRSRSTFMFSSELKALEAFPDWQGEIDRQSLALYLRFGYVPVPRSIYTGILKLPPAHFVVISSDGQDIGEPQCYWRLSGFAGQSPALVNEDPEFYVSAFGDLLSDAVKRRMVSDVPLGAFLSGGIDSTAIVAQMQLHSASPVKTFTIGFSEKNFDEAKYAKEVAQYLGTDHTELYVSPSEVMSVIPSLPNIWDEPFADSSQVPTYLVSKLARTKVTVSLSGDGGDELFYGYSRYMQCQLLWEKISKIPRCLRPVISACFDLLPGRAIEAVVNRLPEKMRINHIADRLPKLGELLNCNSPDSFYLSMMSNFKNPDLILEGGYAPEGFLGGERRGPEFKQMSELMMYLDQVTYLHDDILTKVDRASMAVSLEARVPLLDHRLVEFAWRVPMDLKFRDGQGKWLLRKLLYRHVPQNIIERPKKGFGVPIEQWLTGALRDWCEELLSEQRLREGGFFRPLIIRKMWNEHVSGKRRWHQQLWNILMFQAWLQEGR